MNFYIWISLLFILGAIFIFGTFILMGGAWIVVFYGGQVDQNRVNLITWLILISLIAFCAVCFIPNKWPAWLG